MLKRFTQLSLTTACATILALGINTANADVQQTDNFQDQYAAADQDPGSPSQNGSVDTDSTTDENSNSSATTTPPNGTTATPPNGSQAQSSMVKNIIETASGAQSFSTLITALKAAGLTTVLEGTGPFTVLAPTNSAFLSLSTYKDLLKPENIGKLQSVLKYHIIAGKLSPTDFTTGKLKSLSGDDLDVQVSNGTVTINGAPLAKPVETANGVIYVINKVLTPPEKLTPPTTEPSTTTPSTTTPSTTEPSTTSPSTTTPPSNSTQP